MNKENDKKIYEFALNCALKGIDIEDTVNSVWNSIKELIEPVIELTIKNYKFLNNYKKGVMKNDKKRSRTVNKHNKR